MCGKSLSTLATRTSCPRVNWPSFVLDCGKSHFNCPLICCKMLPNQQLCWHRIKHTGKHYFPHKLSTVPKATKSYFNFFPPPFCFLSSVKQPVTNSISMGSFEDSPIPCKHTELVLHSLFDNRQTVQEEQREMSTSYVVSVSEWGLLRSIAAEYFRGLFKSICIQQASLCSNLILTTAVSVQQLNICLIAASDKNLLLLSADDCWNDGCAPLIVILTLNACHGFFYFIIIIFFTYSCIC